MTTSLSGLRVGLLERQRSVTSPGSLSARLVPELRGRGALLTVIGAEEGVHRLDLRPEVDVLILKSGSAAALHVAAAAESWGIPCVNGGDATRLAQDKLASTAILQRAGLPIAPSRFAWLGGDSGLQDGLDAGLVAFNGTKVLAKAARGSQGAGLWPVDPGALAARRDELPAGPYLVMGWTPHTGDDLKVFVAGDWMGAIERPFPARTLADKEGRPAAIPEAVAIATRAAGGVLGLSCYGCDFVRGPDGWVLVDVNAFPGYKGVPDAVGAIADVVGRAATGGGR